MKRCNVCGSTERVITVFVGRRVIPICSMCWEGLNENYKDDVPAMIDLFKRFAIAIVVAAILPVTSHAYEYRDRFGNLVYTGERRGNETVYRDRYGNTFETETRERDHNVYRDRFGNTIGEDNEE